jgi:hypothetical protein
MKKLSGSGDFEWPKQYLHVRECRTEEVWVVPLSPRATMDLERQLRKWIKQEWAGEMFLDGKPMPRVEGDYYAQLIIDGQSPDGVSCWESGGFYLTTEACALFRSNSKITTARVREVNRDIGDRLVNKGYNYA